MATRQESEEDDDELGLIGPEEVSDQQNLIERVKAIAGTSDDFFAALIANQTRVAQVEQAELEVLREIRNNSDPETVGQFPSEMSHYVPSATTRTDPHEVVRTPGEQAFTRVTAMSLGWQDGASNVVGIQIRTGDGLKLLPRNPEDDYVAFNDFTETFNLRYVLDPGEELVARTVNLDGSNDHFVNIVAQIEELTQAASDERSDGGDD